MASSAAVQEHNPLVIEDTAAHRFRVARRAFVSEDILAIEREYIFNRCWLYVGHESELPKPNDFLRRTVGGRELIFSRDRSGAFHVFHNSCPHRGALVVREACGSALGFQCFYHGWAFNNNGTFATRTGDGNYPGDFNADGSVNLKSVARADSYKGFHFVNYSAHGESLRDYLAGVTGILDVILDHSEAGMEIVSGDHRYSMRANWKLLAENSVDGYHLPITHHTYLKYLSQGQGLDTASAVDPGRFVNLGNGHGVIEGPAPFGRPVANWIPAWSQQAKAEIERIERRLTEHLGPERAARIAKGNRNTIIFPNLVINDIQAITIRTFHPVRPDFMNVQAWALGPKDESAELRQLRLFNFLEFLGPGGFATPDDNEALEACQAGYSNEREAGWNDISKGMMRAEPLRNDEAQMRGFWREWARRTAEAF